MNKETLIEKSISARAKAYVPYSKFPVGAALLAKSGKLIQAANIENASYGLTNCAERNALFTALTQAEQAEDKQFIAIAISADTKRPVPPCGACRQVLLEHCPQNMPVYLTNLNGDVEETTVSALLPGGFTPADLKGD